MDDIFMSSLNYATQQHLNISSSSSSSETSYSTNRTSSNEEVILASTRPKKRAGRRVFKETRHPIYRGVRARDNNKWVCEMRVPNNNKSRIWLGTYPTPEMAARAHDVAALTLRGKSACLNFADSAWRLRLPETTDAVEIRRAAMEAAQLFVVEDKQCEQQSVGEEQVVPVVTSEYDEEMNDLILSIANEPLRSPPPSMTDYYGGNWRDDYNIDMYDTQVSLWNFST
ncbi:dehydration-responsive element-binding protein 1E-like [Cicer arietinum]|uniref:Dehydration-responsive element-binding protein 1E-like n=1 Tax=Cicer arietinum TaxID=3827 RepID=A0A1S2XYS1_CICAR|nr:dehydration-responsive element-binding protein 1E-like [Cicer arietinum]